MPPPPRSSIAPLVWGSTIACALVAFAVVVGRMPRESPDYPGVVLDALPEIGWDGPTKIERDAALGIRVRMPSDGSCARNELDLFVCRYPRRDIAAAWHLDALIDDHDFGKELRAARAKRGKPGASVAARTEVRVVRVADTTALLTFEPCLGTPSDTCRDQIELLAWYGQGARRFRLWVEASFPNTTPRELAAAIVTSTDWRPPAWETLRPQGKRPEIRPELANALTQVGHSLDGSVVLRAPAGATCMSDARGARCFGPRGWYAGITLTEHPRFDSTQYTSLTEWTRRVELRARRKEESQPGELYVLDSMVGFLSREPCNNPSCTERLVLDGYPIDDSLGERVRAELRARTPEDFALGWAALDGARLSARH